jgi:hypothetical protein
LYYDRSKVILPVIVINSEGFIMTFGGVIGCLRDPDDLGFSYEEPIIAEGGSSVTEIDAIVEKMDFVLSRVLGEDDSASNSEAIASEVAVDGFSDPMIEDSDDISTLETAASPKTDSAVKHRSRNSKRPEMKNMTKRQRYYYAHKELEKARHQKYCLTHKQQIAESHHRYHQLNKEKEKISHQQYRLTHKEAISASHHRYRQVHNEKEKAFNLQYYYAHREEILEARRQSRLNHKRS